MDFLDTFERYGFLDMTCDIHSVGVHVNDQSFNRVLKELGDPDEAWVALQNFDSPLENACRRVARGGASLAADEMAAMGLLNDIITAHLDRYPTTISEDKHRLALEPGSDERVPLQVLVYEKTILLQKLVEINEKTTGSCAE